MTRFSMKSLLVILLAVTGITLHGQKIEMIDGVRVVHNQGKGLWGKSPQVTLEKIRTLGDIEAMDETVAFYMPMDIELDKSGNLYVLDTGNHRIQKFSLQGHYLSTIGQKGQGPGEFIYPGSLALDTGGGLIVTSPYSNRIQFLDSIGKEVRSLTLTENLTRYIRSFGPNHLLMASRRRTPIPGEDDHQNGLEPLIQILDREGKFIRTIGIPKDFKHGLVNTKANDIAFTIDSNQNIYVTFTNLNRIEKYAPEGKILWRANRKLDYKSDKPLDKGKIDTSKNSISINSPKMNRCSEAIAVDDQGRVWVITLNRQLKREEMAHTSVSISRSGGNSTVSMSPRGEGEVYETNAYRLDVFDPEGVLLGQLPLDHFADIILISGDRLFILDKLRRMQVIEYRMNKTH